MTASAMTREALVSLSNPLFTHFAPGVSSTSREGSDLALLKYAILQACMVMMHVHIYHSHAHLIPVLGIV